MRRNFILSHLPHESTAEALCYLKPTIVSVVVVSLQVAHTLCCVTPDPYADTNMFLLSVTFKKICYRIVFTLTSEICHGDEFKNFASCLDFFLVFLLQVGFKNQILASGKEINIMLAFFCGTMLFSQSKLKCFQKIFLIRNYLKITVRKKTVGCMIANYL